MVAMAMPLSFFSWVNYVFTFVHLADAFKSSATSIAFKLCITWELNPSFTVLGKIKEHVFSSVPLLFQILPIMRTVQKCKWGCCFAGHAERSSGCASKERSGGPDGWGLQTAGQRLWRSQRPDAHQFHLFQWWVRYISWPPECLKLIHLYHKNLNSEWMEALFLL